MITRRNDGVTTYQFSPLRNLNVDQRNVLEQAIANFSFLIPWGESVTWDEFAMLIADTGNHPKANLICSLIEMMGGDRQ